MTKFYKYLMNRRRNKLEGDTLSKINTDDQRVGTVEKLMEIV